MQLTDRIPTKKAAAILGVNPGYLMQEMKKGTLDLGYVGKTKQRHTYVIFRKKLEALIGRELTEEDLQN